MKRRAFLKLALGTVAAVATGVGSSIAAPQVVKAVVAERVLPPQINPAYLNAPYEESFIFHRDLTDIMCRESERLSGEIALRISRRSPWTEMLDPCPLRYEMIEGQYRPVEPFVFA